MAPERRELADLLVPPPPAPDVTPVSSEDLAERQRFVEHSPRAMPWQSVDQSVLRARRRLAQYLEAVGRSAPAVKSSWR